MHRDDQLDNIKTIKLESIDQKMRSYDHMSSYLITAQNRYKMGIQQRLIAKNDFVEYNLFNYENFEQKYDKIKAEYVKSALEYKQTSVNKTDQTLENENSGKSQTQKEGYDSSYSKVLEILRQQRGDIAQSRQRKE